MWCYYRQAPSAVRGIPDGAHSGAGGRCGFDRHVQRRDRARLGDRPEECPRAVPHHHRQQRVRRSRCEGVQVGQDRVLGAVTQTIVLATSAHLLCFDSPKPAMSRVSFAGMTGLRERFCGWTPAARTCTTTCSCDRKLDHERFARDYGIDEFVGNDLATEKICRVQRFTLVKKTDLALDRALFRVERQDAISRPRERQEVTLSAETM